MMQPISIPSNAPNDRFFPKAVAYFEGGVTEEVLTQILEQLTLSPSLLGDERCCALFGYGSRTRQAYRELHNDPTVSVIWSGACMPWPLKPLSLIVAAQSGFVIVKDRSGLVRTFRSMATLAMAELYSFSSQFFDRVIEHAMSRMWRSRLGDVVGLDESYFCLGVDGDSTLSKTGLLGWTSYGMQCPADLSNAAQLGVSEQ